jgi:hypothetical protein
MDNDDNVSATVNPKLEVCSKKFKTKRRIMKTTPILHMTKIACLALAAIGFTVASSQAQVVIGSWQTGLAEGWTVNNIPPPSYNDPNNGLSITDPIVASEYSFVAAGVPGYPISLDVNYAGFGGGLAYNLASNPAALAALNAGNQLQFTFGVPASQDTSGYSQVYALAIYASGYNNNNLGWSSATSVNLAGSNNNSSGMPNYYWGPSGSLRAQTVTFDLSSFLPSIQAGGEGYVNLVLHLNNSGSDLSTMYLNNVELVPEPCTLALFGFGSLVSMMFMRRRAA